MAHIVQEKCAAARLVNFAEYAVVVSVSLAIMLELSRLLGFVR